MEIEVALDEVKPKTCPNSQENGVKVHEMKENVNKIESLNDSGVIEDCVMNGVSSLLKMKQGFNEKDAIDEVAEDSEQEDEEHGYKIGDFVWGKIKNHPWWPGQIYDPLEASDLALKIKQKGKALLVAYFGDGTFAWCHPSQLKSFTENFKECSKISNSKGFNSAVQEAVEEMGNQMERILTQDSSNLNRFATNSGIKQGVLVHNVRREIVTSLLLTKSAERIIRDVHSVATSGTYLDLLELEVVKRRLSVLYRGIGLSKYQEPQSVPGLEDKNNDDETIETIQDSVKLRSLEKCSGFPDNRLQHKKKEKSIAEILENESSAMVKFGEDSGHGNGKSSKKKLKRNDEVNLSTPKRRRASKVAKTEDSGHGINESKGFSKELAEKDKNLGHGISESKGFSKESTEKDENSGHGIIESKGLSKESTEKDENSGLETDIDSTPLASMVKKVKTEAGTQSLKRERKKSKYFSNDYLSDFGSKGRKRSKVDQIESTNDNLVVEKPLEDGLCHEEPLNEPLKEQPLKELSDAVEFLRLGATLEEMCELIRVAALGIEYCRDSSSRDMVKEFMSIYRSFTYHDEINRKLWSLETEKEEPKKLKGKEQGEEDTNQLKLKAKQLGEETEKLKPEAKQQGEELDKPKRRAKRKGEELRKPELKAKQLGEELDKPKLKSKQLGEETDKPKLKAKQRREEIDKPELEAKQLGEEIDKPKPKAKQQGEELEKPKLKAKQQGGELEKPKLKAKQQGEELDKPKAKQQGEEKDKPKLKAKQLGEEKDKSNLKAKQLGEEIDKPQLSAKQLREEIDKPKRVKKDRKFKKLKKGKEEEIEKKFEGVELLVTFGPGSSLPNKEDLIKIYEKFGSLDRERTYMFYNNFCARVAFLNVADGEKAFEFSQEKCPFGDSSKSTIKFRLKYASKEEEKIDEEDNVGVAEATMEIEDVKKKLEEMKMLLDESKGGLREDVKMKFEEEMMNLMEKVKKIKVVGSS